ncbi:MAG TPA: homogentisate 1,2-dioxygenase, partial [Nitrospira sp.]|nr:homogentisate 1,2-dioxygenase [Nitrospira sp.]
RRETTPYFVRNADGDEVHFVHRGRGRFETDYGVLSYEAGDYVLIPKGTTYRVHVDTEPSF